MAIANLALSLRVARRLFTPAPEPAWLHTLGQIAGTALLLELMLALVLVCAIAFGLAWVAHWTQINVVPVIGEYSARTKQVVDVGARAGDRIVEGVAEFHGRRQGFETALRVFFLGPKAASDLVRQGASHATELATSTRAPVAHPALTDAPHPAPTLARPSAQAPTTPRPPTPRMATTPRMAMGAASAVAARPVASAVTAPTAPTMPTPTTAAPAKPTMPTSPSPPIPTPSASVRVSSWLAVGRAGTPGGTRAGYATGVGPFGLAR